MDANIAFVGLGNQGGPIAIRMLNAGFKLAVWTRKPEAAAHFIAQGAVWAPTLHQLAVGCEIFCVCVVDDAGVLEVVEKILPVMKSGATIVVFSTIHPDTCRDLAAQAAMYGVDLIDAPVSGGADAAHEGKLTVMIGGSESAYQRCLPLLTCVGAMIAHLGVIGSGQKAKLINNGLMAANIKLASEAREMAASFGIDIAALDRLVMQSSGRSFAYDILTKLPNRAAFAAGAVLLKKDVDLLESLVEKSETPSGSHALIEIGKKVSTIFCNEPAQVSDAV